ncbi:rhodanese-like domain-containing protein [Parasphingopyxis sp. CP4]|uniref:rhodanese-like domain-containing protein n=1 Tax=Parasphingopyxis sp. CP4 TaxID=2724527 RepID=UPI0015A49172|nr:rhodanese-like domain-containing protein [Parasphingopyxis sp. CP4]QLC22951.1 rhodanese-like domain-containing protein [Parasphingopyxis sp. CP4]
MAASVSFLGRAICAAALFATATSLSAQGSSSANNPQIDFPAFVAMAATVQEIRESHLLGLTDFQAMAARPDTLLLDARSAEAFRAGHIEGAVNLPLPDFTAGSLADVIGPDSNRPILIYCNNNFVNDVAPVVRKAVSLALNIQTMINLHGYGYANVFELADAVDLTDPTVRWVALPDIGGGSIDGAK